MVQDNKTSVYACPQAGPWQGGEMNDFLKAALPTLPMNPANMSLSEQQGPEEKSW